MNFGVIGYGLMGQQRVKAVLRLGHRVVAVHDPDRRQLAKLPEGLAIATPATYQEMLADDHIDVIVVSVPHHDSEAVCRAVLQAGKHLFCEKPLGRNRRECAAILRAVLPGQELGVGFNYRHYPGVQQVKRAIASGELGAVTHLRAVLGHGGRPGYEKEWKTSKELCGGGALFDPGIHVIDLIRYLMGEIVTIQAQIFRSFWKIDVEDNVFLTARTADNGHAQAHVSITEWKNRMSLDVFGTDACLQLRGRAGFYGAQVVRHTPRWGWLETPRQQERVTVYPLEDLSFTEELRLWIERIQGRPAPGLACGNDAFRAMEIVESLYEDYALEETMTETTDSRRTTVQA